MKRAVFVFALLALAACTDPARVETRSLADAVTRFRLAGDGEKHARITDVQQVKCTAHDVCAARETCLRMAEEWDHSLTLRVQVNTALADLKNGTLSKDDPRAQALPSVLDESQASLEHAHALGKTCDDQLSELTARHK
jgi:hypothetical protein